MNINNYKVLPVLRSKKQARKAYDRISRFYDYTEGIFEKKHINKALEQLDIKKGEIILEIGFGTGNAILKMAEYAGKDGFVYGIDISPKMLELTNRKIKKRSYSNRVSLTCKDAVRLPYPDKIFDAVFLSFTLELFDNPEIPEVLKEIRRVLKPKGRLGAISLCKDDRRSFFLRLYEWAHIKFPNYIDCRPILVAESIKDEGFYIQYREKAKIFLAPIETVIGIKD